MKATRFCLTLLLFSSGMLLLSTCQKEGDDIKIKKDKVSGYVQKGPFINGTSILMSELNSSMVQTGKIFTAQIINNSGSFEINNISLASSYVEFSANGYYFNEVQGDLSPATLNLYALSDLTDILTVNINILTHLEKQRVAYLVKQNKSFSEAKNIAQGEILAIFGFSLNEMDNSEELDISVNNESNAILLAISIILQGNRSVSDLTELLATITNDIREDGILNSESIMLSLRNSTKELNLSTIRSSLVNRYQNLGISATIPGFEKYINDFLVFTGQKPITTTQAATNITTTSVTLNAVVNANSLSTAVIFEYGKTINYGDTINATQSPVTGSSSVSVSTALTELLPGTTYHFRVKTKNSLGITYGSDLTFTSLGQLPSATTQEATDITTVSVILKGTVNANLLSTTVMFEWGKTITYSDSITATQSPVSGSTPFNVSSEITELSPGTLYHFRIKTKNALGTVYGSDLTFTTLGGVPTASTQAATSIIRSGAILNGMVNANDLTTTVTFEYGTTETYGSTIDATPNTVIGHTNTIVNVALTGLNPETTYHFRVKSVNSLGTTYGSDMTFLTILQTTINVKVEVAEDDAEEYREDYLYDPAGFMDIVSTDLELCTQNANNRQYVGIIWRNVTIPAGATIISAFVQFTCDDNDNQEGPLPVDIVGIKEVNTSAPFTSDLFNISSRPVTSAKVTWDIPVWATIEERGPDQKTTDIKTIIQEIIDQAGWASGNNLGIRISNEVMEKIHREASSFEDMLPGIQGPELIVTYM